MTTTLKERSIRRASVVVDNPSWILPFAERLVADICAAGDDAALVRDYADLGEGEVAFFLGCIHIAPPPVLGRNHRNLVVHASNLPKGRGFSPLTWQILDGDSRIPVCLLEAVNEVDSGPVLYREWVEYEGHELVSELRQKLGEMTIHLCRRFLAEEMLPSGIPQSGEPTFYPRRRPIDSRLDPDRSIAEQFDLLRVVDNESYPAWFDHRGYRYKITIEKMLK